MQTAGGCWSSLPLAQRRRGALNWLHEHHGELHPSLQGGGPLVVRLRLSPDLALVQGSGEWHHLTVELPAASTPQP